MTDVQPAFGYLADVSARDAWHHEARALTPWLAANLDRLETALGMKLELEGTELRVESFAADILARDVATGGRVLIENQLEQSDHGHLGQIMTYLAGLQAETMVWIAPSFREPHLSAIRWLNEHTIEPFAFFAVRLRVVRIGDSPFAPLFEVIERPNAWDRTVQERAREASAGMTELGNKRLAFWSHFVARHPSEGSAYRPDAASSRWRAAPGLQLNVVQYVAKDSVGVFVRPPRGGSSAEVQMLLEPHRNELENCLGTPVGSGAGGSFLASRLSIDTDNKDKWDSAGDWLHAQATRYHETLRQVLSLSEAGD